MKPRAFITSTEAMDAGPVTIKKAMRLTIAVCVKLVRPVLICLLSAPVLFQPVWAESQQQSDEFRDLLNYHGAPGSSNDHSFNIFFDAGAWHGYSLPPESEAGSGFVGPFVHSLGKGQWVGNITGRLKLRDAETQHDLLLTATSSFAAPGYLRRTFKGDELTVEQTLYFPDSWHSVLRTELSSNRSTHIAFASGAQMFRAANVKGAAVGDHYNQKFSGTRSVLSTRLVADGFTGKVIETSPADVLFALDRPLVLDGVHPAVVVLEQTLVTDTTIERPPAINYTNAWNDNRARWTGYMAAMTKSHLAGLPDPDARHVAAKAVVTLLGNWRAARGDLLHDGVVPSYSDVNYNGFWAWDSWKHVVALARFAPELARSQMLAMFDYQTDSGMVPDCIFMQKADNNNRDSKPPLAGWAALKLFQATGDREFLAAIYDRLQRYHRWWSLERDHDHNGLAEYGSTDGTLIAAAWESGMDNAVRFDDTAMLKNSSTAWSADQESVDLNAYLYDEKRDLAEIAGILGKDADRLQWQAEAEKLKVLIQKNMFDADSGYFFDRKLKDGSALHVFGPEGWLPLWAGVASNEQALRVAAVLNDTKKFATRMPFPTLAADDARFSPVTGYWRGSVWIDQAYFAIAGLHRYGLDQQANAMALKLVLNAQGLTAQTPFHEVYDPLTGTGMHAPNFSWSAAHFLMLLSE